MSSIDSVRYASLYGPSEGDRVRLADTGLLARVERDDTDHGDELLGGFGKTMREGLLSTSRPGPSELDLIISNVLLIDPVLGIRKTNIGVKDGRVVGLGRAGNPDGLDDVDLVVGAHTPIIPGEGLIATPGIVDSHVHLSSASLVQPALASGVTTLVGMGIGGAWDVGVNPARNQRLMIQAWRDIPMNVAFLSRGSATDAGLLESALLSGASGFKVHEDFGAQPAVIDTCLGVAEAADVPVALHTDSLNESGMLSDTVDATRGRTVHAYHVEGGGGHPDLLEILRHPHVLASSTTPTLPYTANTVRELLPMTMTVHRQHEMSPGDVEASTARVRANAIAAENALHDLGAVSIINSDSMGMGRIAETVRSTWQLAAVNKAQSGETPYDDNQRILRYIAKITINPARAHGLARHVGSLEVGKMADIVLWNPAWFGAKPDLVIKSGFVAWGVTGSGSGSTRLVEPRRYRPYFGGSGGAARSLAAVFVAAEALDASASRSQLPTGVTYLPVTGACGLSRADMLANTAVPLVRVPRDGGRVMVDGVPCGISEAQDVPLNRLHHFA